MIFFESQIKMYSATGTLQTEILKGFQVKDKKYTQKFKTNFSNEQKQSQTLAIVVVD